MAKKINSNLPKVISKANHDISTLIEKDIERESKLLKDLVDDVLQANLEIKKRNNERINKTKEKLMKLDEEIEKLSSSIDVVDRETVIEQLNDMIDSKNEIFKSRLQIRFYTPSNLEERLQHLQAIYSTLEESILNTKEYEKVYRKQLTQSDQALLQGQIDVTNRIIETMDQLFEEKRHSITHEIQNRIKDLLAVIKEKEQELHSMLLDTMKTIKTIQDSSSQIFRNDVEDDYFNAKIKEEHENRIHSTKEELEQAEQRYQIQHQELLDEYHNLEQKIREELEQQHQEELKNIKQMQQEKEQELQEIRLQIMNAEKRGDVSQVNKLLKRFNKIEKSKKTKLTSKLTKDVKSNLKKPRQKLEKQIENLAINHARQMSKLRFLQAQEDLQYEEDQIVYRMKSDYKGLQEERDLLHNQIEELLTAIKTSKELYESLEKTRLELRHLELTIMEDNEYKDLELIDTYQTLLLQLKETENKRILLLEGNKNQYQIVRYEQEYNVKKSIEDMKLDQELQEIDQRIVQKKHETKIKKEQLQEKANAEIIYQQSLIKIAQKEHKLQKIKVQSLYENEQVLAEEQIDRVNLGVKVNDKFVKTTLENQLLFASQQINAAKSEFDIRMENIQLTHEQELEYANKKINYYKQQYEYEKSKLEKERDAKLEDLEYKLLLFTESSDQKEIQNQINGLKDKYNTMIQEINDVEEQDKQILRYEKVIKDADNRAELAIQEAEQLKKQTVESFQQLYDKTQEKYDYLKENEHSEDTQGLMPILNNKAVLTAGNRLEKAMNEADALLEERTKEPKNIINQIQTQLDNDLEEINAFEFIEEQEALKKELIEAHQQRLQQLLEQKQQAIEPIKKDMENYQTILKQELESLEKSFFESVTYRDNEDIKNDYVRLRKLEQERFLQLVSEYDNWVSEAIQSMKQKEKTLLKLIKKAFKPYKKYMKYAAKGVNAKKKQLKKKFDKELKKRVSDIKDNFVKSLQIEKD